VRSHEHPDSFTVTAVASFRRAVASDGHDDLVHVHQYPDFVPRRHLLRWRYALDLSRGVSDLPLVI